jgi:hypothetical protein
LALAALAFVALGFAPTALATSNTTIGFDALAAGTIVTNQYAADGITFGKASDFGINPGNPDCGPPTVSSDAPDARSAPNVAVAPRCSSSDSSPVGTFAALSFARKSVSAYVGTAAGAQGVKAILIGYDSSGTFVAFTPQTTIGAGAHTQLSISRPSADIAYVAIYIEGVVGGGTPLLIDDLSLDNSAAPLAVSGRTFGAVADSPFSGTVAHIADGDPTAGAGDYNVSIGWGDGQSSMGSVSTAPGGGFDVSGAHTYGSVGSDAVTVIATKVNGLTATGHATATISAPATTASPVRAAFAVARGVPGRLLVSASSSRPAGAAVTSYAWSLDGHTGAADSALCGGDASQLTTRMSAGTHSLTLTVTDAHGVRTSVSHNVVVPPGPPAVTAGAARASGAPAFVHVFTCSPGPGDHPGDVTAQGGPPAGCATEVQFGLADAVGCLTRITQRSQWPAAEGKIVHQLTLSSYHPCATCARDAAARVALSVGQTEDALSAAQDPYFSTRPVRINGIDFYPALGAAILLVPNQNMVISSNATVELGGVPLKTGQIIVYVPQGAGNTNRVHIDDYTLSEQAKRIGIGDLPFDGSMGLDFVYHRSQLSVHVKLPDVFSADPSGSDPITGGVSVSTDNAHGLLLDSVDIRVPEAFLGPLEVDNLFFHYQRQGNVWNGGADVIFPGGALKATPPPPDNGFGLKDGSFDHAGATLTFAEPIEIFTGVDLTHISFSLGLNPTRFTGGVGIDVVDIVHVDGSLAMVFASSGAPYVFPANAGPGLESIAGHRVSSTAFAVGGKVSLITPIGDLALGSAYALYVFPDYLEFGGGFYYDFGVGHLDGHIFGALQPSKAKFDLEGGLHACIDDLGCLGIDAVVSSRGIAGCVDTFVADVGFGDYWGHFPSIYFHGCDIGPYTDRAAADRSRAQISAVGSTQFRLGAGLPSAMVKATGATDAPQVTLTGPHGEHMTTPAAPRYVNGSKFTWLRQRVSKTTFIGIAHPAAGTWTLSIQPGSSPITSVSHANGLAQPQIHARVTGRGSRRTLTYAVGSLDGREITFAEQGPGTARVIGHATAAHGRLHFTPGPGPAGRRRILATVAHNGLQMKQLTVTSYKAPGPQRPARPANVRATRRRGGLVISWGRSRGAVRYAVSVQLSDGRRQLLLTRGGKRTVQVGSVGPSTSGFVRVVGLTAANSASRVAIVRVNRLRARRPHPLPRLRV